MTAREEKQRLERIWKDYTSAYDTASIEDLMAFDMATNALGAIEQIQWERDMAIKQLHDLGYGLGEKPREKLNNSNQEMKKSNQEVKKLSGLIERQKAIDLAHELIVPNEYKYGLYNQAINNYCVEIMNLPSAQPEPKTGEWNFDGNRMYECTNCGVAYTEYQFEKMRVRYNDPKFPKFCPNCGSYNGGDSDDQT